MSGYHLLQRLTNIHLSGINMNILHINLFEECAEVIQALSKVIRFTSEHKHYETSNGERLNEEVNQLFALLLVLSKVDKDFALNNEKILAKTAQILKNADISFQLNNQ
jgi:hypothetical protein